MGEFFRLVFLNCLGHILAYTAIGLLLSDDGLVGAVGGSIILLMFAAPSILVASVLVAYFNKK